MTYLSDALRDASASSVFWLVLALVLIVAIVGYLLARRAKVGLPSDGDAGKVIHDWAPTGRIDFSGPTMDPNAADTPAAFYLQAEDIRLLVSFSGIERKEIRWRKATLNEAKRVVNIFHMQTAKDADRTIEKALPAAAPSGEGATEPTAKDQV